MRLPPVKSWGQGGAPDPATGITNLDPTPLASIALLLAADSVGMAVGFGLYGACGHMYDSNLSGAPVRRASVIVPPGVTHTRCWVTRWSSPFETGWTPGGDYSQQKHTSANAVEGLTGANISTQASPCSGSEGFGQTVSCATAASVVGTAETISPLPLTAIDRALPVVAATGSAPLVYEFGQMGGVCVQFWRRPVNLETI